MKLYKKILILMTGALIMTCGCGNKTNTEGTAGNDISVIVNTVVTPGGQFPTTLKVTIPNLSTYQINASDFTMEGESSNWMDPSLHKFTANFKDASVDGDVLTLYFDTFKDKYFFVDNWKVTNASCEALNFSSDDIFQVITPVADDFTYHSRDEGDGFDYQLYTPEDRSAPLPIVVVFHGFADTHNLGAYRTSIAWAEPDAQAKRPCYVLAPIIDDNTYFQGAGRASVFPKVYDKLMKMIDDGLVDTNRIYIMGNSFGGMSTIEFMEMYPDVAAAGMPLCAALNYSQTYDKHLDLITNIPLWIAAAENDNTIPSENSKNLYESLKSLGAADNKLTIYSDEEMNAAGGSSDPNSTFSYHHVEMAVMEDEAYADWLFSHTK